MVVELHPEVLAAYAEAVGFYEQHAPGLGREFFGEVERVLRLIEENASIGSPLDGPYRRAYCRRFPFGIVYREGRDVIWVQAVMHLASEVSREDRRGRAAHGPWTPWTAPCRKPLNVIGQRRKQSFLGEVTTRDLG